MSLHIDDETDQLVAELAGKLSTTEQCAVNLAVRSELKRLANRDELRRKLAEFYERHPLPPPTGLKADKAFFDELSGEFD